MDANNKFTQPVYNIGMIGTVASGKSTCVKSMTDVETFKHSKEKERGITIKIGYANCKIFKCPTCPEPDCYHSTGSKVKFIKCNKCGSDTEIIQYFSFIDCPGHESLMNTMLSGATIMDYAIVLVDATQKFPESQPQTVEHLIALEILKIKKVIIIQNKLDLVDGNKALEQYNDIKNYIKGTCAEFSPIIPLSAQKKYNIDVLCEFIVKYFGEVNRTEAQTKMNIIRSFDVNKPGSDISSINGGVLGGSLICGQFKIGDIIEIRPGLVQRTENQTLTWKPIITEIVSMRSDSDEIDEARPGGLIGLCTNLDPALTRSDRMVGHVVGLIGAMPNVFTKIKAKCTFMERIGLSNFAVSKPKKGDNVLLNISSKTILATIKHVNGSRYMFELKFPCCMCLGERFSISTKIGDSWKLIGMGELF
jgi:translation initiation factor 2 subunit 3